MTSKILLYLHSNDNTIISWIKTDNEDILLEERIRVPIADLATLEKNAVITLIVPGEDVLVTSVDLPKMQRSKLRNAIPFALEEKLISDVNELHFAIGETEPGEPTPVVVVKKQKLEHWLQLLREAGLTPQAVIPSIFAIPDPWHVCLDEKIAIVRTYQWNGFACDLHNLQTLLALELTKQTMKPDCVHLHRFLHAEIKLDFDSVPVKETTTRNNLLFCMQKWLMTYSHINLLQGEYEIKEKQFFLKKSWTITCLLGITWIAILFFNQISSYFMLHHAVQQNETAIAKIYKKHFPNATDIVAPRDRMNSQLQSLTQQSSKNLFFSLFADIGDTLQKISEVELQNIDYRDNHFTLQIEAKNFDALDHFIKTMREKGVSVKQQNASTSGSIVKASVLIGTKT